MAGFREDDANDPRHERRHRRLRRLSPRPIVVAEKAAVAFAAISVDLALAGIACVLVAILWGGWDVVWREPLAFGGLLVYGLPISALGAWWGILRHRDEVAPPPLSCFARAFAGAGVGMAIAVGVTVVLVGLVLLACGIA